LVRFGAVEGIPRMLRFAADVIERGCGRTKAFVETFEEVKRITGRDDPYAEAKRKLASLGREVAMRVERRLAELGWSISEALRVSAAANIIDTSILGYEARELDDAVLNDRPEIAEIPELRGVREVVIALDNAGEAQIDLLLARALSENGYTVEVAVREKPYEIDVTARDMQTKGFDVVETPGSDPPVIHVRSGYMMAKGIANLEAALEHGVNALLLFRAKCVVLSDRLKVRRGAPILAETEKIRQMLLKF